MEISSSRSRVVAVLGPTNTGKTHLAMSRMLGYESGMIGFPLRLLARENYERAVQARGRAQVALITGEEKILPPGARYFLCTVESMPLDRRVAFVGIDEIQMCADPDRGHVFAHRLLHARGTVETMFMGAETIRPVIRALVPEAVFETRPRMSTLTYSGRKKITRLPARSAIVAFSAADVYAIAELVRRQRGGAAVVLGALSPRTRNAQVAMYQAREVDYLVATDAIGMGLNMDVHHVAFAQTRKFDGRVPRDLRPEELAQIAGRAGRHMHDGTFGTTADVEGLDPDVAARIEAHDFDDLKTIFWRNARLRFTSIPALKASLTRVPDRAGLVRARPADDELALDTLARIPEIAEAARSPERVALLWEVCRIPDFGNVLRDAHTRLLAEIYRHLTGPSGRLPTDWVAAQVARIDNTEGDIEALAQRLANIRTWTYVSYHGAWIADSADWQARTRDAEDRLSDVLHDRLTARFVDRRTAVLMRRLKDRAAMTANVDDDGAVEVEGHHVGRLSGFRFVLDAADDDRWARKAVTHAALKALRGGVGERVAALQADADEAFALTADGRLLWRGAPIARLVAGPDVLSPAVDPVVSELLPAEARERVRARLAGWVGGFVESRLNALGRLRAASLNGAARGLAFQLGEALGSLPRRRAAEQVDALSQNDRRALRALGVRIGRESVFLPALMKPAAVEARAVLWAVFNACPPPDAIPAGRVSVPVAEGADPAFYEALGYRALGRLALRVDMLERIAAEAWERSRKAPVEIGPELLSLAGCSAEDMAVILRRIGFRPVGNGFRPKGRRASRPAPVRAERPDSPFAKLRELGGTR